MNKSALKNFATIARKELIDKVKARAFRIGITEESIKKAQIESSDAIYIDGKQLSSIEKKQRDKLIQRINDIGFGRVIEEVSYTWFNRFTALRFMEVNNYLPSKVRVLSSSNADNLEPDIIKEALSVDLDIDKDRVYELKINNKTEDLFKYLIIKQCNNLNQYLPFMFETIDDYKEILFPEGLLAKDSFIREMTDGRSIRESDWENVEIIGWLYQFYISDEKDRVFKAKKKYKAHEIPFATQLFTPGWIVKYLVENSLGRYWIESHPENRDLIDNWKFYIEIGDRDEDTKKTLTPYFNNELKVEDIKCFDPAMGSGHMLAYMFDVLFEIYIRCGYMEREIPRLIIENNLFGLDVDDRAYQLACFTVVMKAMQYNNRFFRSIQKEGLTLNLTSIQETNNLKDDDIAYFAGDKQGVKYNLTKKFVESFRNAKTLGSLIKLEEIDCDFFEKRLDHILNKQPNDIFEYNLKQRLIEVFPKLIKQTKILTSEFDVLVTNPPYMGTKYMNEDLANYVKKEYPDSKTDIGASFMEISHCVKSNGFIAMINQHSWMFISSFEGLRKKIIKNNNIYSMLHLGANAFEEINGEVVQSTAFVMRNSYTSRLKGEYIRLVDFKDSQEKEAKTLKAVINSNVAYRYSSIMDDYLKISGLPIAYWVTEKVREIFRNEIQLGDIAAPRKGNSTSDNNRFLRFWYEVDNHKINFDKEKIIKEETTVKRWFPYNKGGGYRKWYGNNEYLVDWKNDAEEIRNIPTAVIANYDYFMKPGLTWSTVTTSKFSIRLFGKGFIFDNGGCCLFTKENDRLFFLALLNSKVFSYLLGEINPTLNFQSGEVAKLPVKFPTENVRSEIDNSSNENYVISKKDWDILETSWDFAKHPILEFRLNTNTIEQAFNNWSNYSEEQFQRVRKNEEKINEMLIDLYGLHDEITPNVSEKEITISKSDRERDIKSFISYAVGCMFGRYSIDEEGLIFAGNKFYPERYKTFAVDKDNILPILSGAYFEDDIVSKFMEFVKVTFGEDTLDENLEYLADSLGRKDGETAKETLRRYLLNDFFKDHLQTYKKKPIYWLFTSGKQKAFNCLIYMHRYDKSTLSRIRTDYLHELQIRMDAERKSLLDIIDGDGTAKEISNAKKELKSLDLKIEELRAYDEQLHHMADMQIEFDLDDGVAVNYAKFEGLLAPIK
ncbi:BREX-1 system adenine-specific DNA-methyltransferase PglX [Brevibacillus sp. 179-C9.3 HS]|uniref:BREX-1 system adenine-specific DNA-methyltransferase PglX n=1 Tax=unclassified Brevibacillus TaxID=2684853 RepID=UPI0039A37B3D